MTPPRVQERSVPAVRAKVKSTRAGAFAWRTAVTLLGVGIVVLGVALLPLPGPGWLIIFAGLGLLATEYEWAARLLRAARHRVGLWTAWVARQGRLVQALIGLGAFLLAAGVAAAAWWWYFGRGR
jgi:uncharacterized protein (TIGR02611 family)